MRPGLLKHVKFCRVAIAFQKEDVVGIDSANSLVEPPIERHKHRFTGISRFVDGVVAGYPGMSLVTIGNGFPEMNHPVLKVLMLPEQSLVRRIVAMPCLILVAGQGMQIDNGVDVLLSAQFNHSVQVLEAFFPDHKWL